MRPRLPDPPLSASGPQRLRPSGSSLLRLAVLMAVICAGLVGLLVLQTGLGWSEMDWNSDGRTSLLELVQAIDVEKRTIATAEGQCEEYLRYRDSTLVAMRCR